MSRLAWTNLLSLSFIWGAAFTFSGSAVKEVGFSTVVFLRVFIALAVVSGFLAYRRQLPHMSFSLLTTFLVMGLINNVVPFGFLFWAQSPLDGTETAKISSGLASIFNALTPFFAMLVARYIFFEERLSFKKATGVGLGFLGVTLLFIGTGAGDNQQGSATWSYLAMAGCIIAAFSYGFGVVYGRRFARLGLTPTQGAFGQLMGSSLLALPLMLTIDQPWSQPLPSTSFWAAMLGLAILSTALAYMIYFWLIENAGAVNAALVTLLIPTSAMILGALFLNESFGLWDFMGLGCILLGLLVIDGRLLSFRTS